MGGVINTVTKSGQNTTHGTGYWFFRNRTLEATDRYANGYNLPEWRHTAGASLGGAIKKDKLFYFANFDFTDRNFPALNRIVNNSLTDPTGNFIPASNCVPAAARPHAGPVHRGHQLHPEADERAGAAHLQAGLGFAKLDYHVNDRNTISFDMNVMHWRLAARNSDAGRAHRRRRARQQRQLHGGRPLRQGFLDRRRHHQRRQRTALRLVQGSPLRSRRQRSVPGRDRRNLHYCSRLHGGCGPSLSPHLSQRKSLPDRREL